MPQKGPVKGLLIHSLKSNICASAIADRAIDHSGGIINVTMTKGQESYNTLFNKVNGIDVEIGDFDNVSFIISKVDGPLFTTSKIRLINDEGSIDSRGRLEIKIDRLWTTVKRGNNQTINDNVAYNACK